MTGIRSFITSTSIYSILGALPAASRIILLPVFLQYLTPKDFGMIGLSSTIASALTIFMTLGFDHAFSRFYFDYKFNKKLLHSFLSTVIITVVTISLAFAVLISLFGDDLQRLLFKDPSFSFYPFGVSALVIAGMSGVNGIILNYFRNEEKPRSFFYFSMALFLFSTICEYLAIVHFSAGAEEVIVIKVAALALVSLCTWVWVLFKIGFTYELRFLRSSLHYSVPIIPYIFFGFIYSSFDRIMIENHLDLATLAVFNVAVAIGSFVEIGLNGIHNATYPSIYNMFKKGHVDERENINKTYRLIGLIVITLICLCSILAPLAILNLLKPAYRTAVAIIPFILLGTVLRYVYIIYAEPLFFFKKTKWLPWINISTGCSLIVFNLIFLPRFGLYGAGLSLVLSRVVQNLITYYLSLRSSDFRFDLKYMYGVVITLACALIFLASISSYYLGSNLIYIIFLLPFAAVLAVFLFLFFRSKASGTGNFNLSTLKQLV